MSICTRCGKSHDTWGGVCPGDDGKPASRRAANALQTSTKTMFGVAPAPIPGLPKPAPRPGYAATLLASAARAPLPARPALPSAEEARQNPDLVVSLEKGPPARPGMKVPAAKPNGGSSLEIEPISAPVRAIVGSPAAKPAADPPLLLDRDEPAAVPPVDLPDVGPPIDLPAFASPGPAEKAEGTPPMDLPKPGSGRRFALPEAPADPSTDPSLPPHRRGAHTQAERLAADLKSVVDLLGWASAWYFGRGKQLLWLVGLLVIPAAILESCLAAGIISRTTSISITATTVDFSARKAELAARIQESQARRQLDAQAVAELAALTAAEAAHLPVPGIEVERGGGWLRERLALFLQGLLILGLAFPVACGLIALAWYDKESGAALPAFADGWPILVARGELILVTLLPAAALVGLGYALFVVPGLVLSVLFLFLPHVVLFEKKRGRRALARGLELLRGDFVRAALTCFAFALAGGVIALLGELLLPTGVSRASAFLHFILCNVLMLAMLPIPALVLARLYLDARSPAGVTCEHLARAARG